MKTAAALAATLALLAAAPAFAQAAPISTETTPISEIIANPEAKALLEKAVPQISGFYDQVGAMTLAQVAPMSQGALDEEKLKALQAEFDKLKK